MQLTKTSTMLLTSVLVSFLAWLTGIAPFVVVDICLKIHLTSNRYYGTMFHTTCVTRFTSI